MMKLSKTSLLLRALLLPVLGMLAAGCGYHVGSMAHPQLKTVAIAPVANDTTLLYAASLMRSELCERFMIDGSYKLVDMDEADLIVFVKINSYGINASGSSSYDAGRGVYMPSTWAITLNATVSVSIPGRAALLVNNANISRTGRYQNNIDILISQQAGVKQACYLIAGDIVSMTAEAW